MSFRIQPEIRLPELTAAASEAEYALHQAAVEWSLAEPIIIDSSEDIRSKVNWQDTLEPYHHQVRNLMTFCRKLPVTLIADDVGLGKTISAGLILSELMVRNRVSRTLVVCPSLLGPQWIEELESKFGIFGRWVTGKDLDGQLNGSCPVVATTYHSISSRLGSINAGSFDMLILDEAHKVRNLYGTAKAPKFATNIRAALQDRLFKYVVMLTATPIQNRLWDLYSLLDCLAVAKGHKNPFGSPDDFRAKYIADSATTARQLNQRHAPEFRRILRQYVARTRRQDVQLQFPDREVKLFRVAPSSLDRSLQRLVAEQIESVNALLRTSLATAMMSSPQALLAQLKTMAVKNQRWDQLAGNIEAEIQKTDTPSKLAGLLRIIEQLRGRKPDSWRMIVFTTRIETQKLIVGRLQQQRIACGVIQGGAAQANNRAVKRFTCSPPEVNVLVSTDSGAEGINLQAGNVLVNYDLPWNPMVVEQRIGRVQRLASQHAKVIIVNLAVAGSPEEHVVVRLIEKLQTISHTVGDIESILEATGQDGDKASESFESRIRNLVIESLKGQNTERATELAVRSIQEAKELFENQRAEIDAKLGRLEGIHKDGPAMPRLEKVEPRTEYRQFVKDALTAEGYELSTSLDGVLKATRPGVPAESIVFTDTDLQLHSQPGMFHGRSPKLYAPGKPHFERLVQRWLDRAQHATRDFRHQTQPLARTMCEGWLTRISESTLEDVELVDVERHWQGRTSIRVTAINSVDSYETLVDVEHVPPGHGRLYEQPGETGKVMAGMRLPDGESPQLKSDAAGKVASDRNITAFEAFYSQRLQEEIGRADGDSQLTDRIRNDFQPAIHGQAAGQQGMLYESCRVLVKFAIDGHSGYSTELLLCPATEQFLPGGPTWSRCAETGAQVPDECLATCDISQLRVLRHLLVTSDESGRPALARHTEICAATGQIALTDEFGVSDCSGRRAVASAFSRSPVSNRKGLADEFVACQFTSDLVLKDEILISEISGLPYRQDQSERSAVSGTAGHSCEFVKCAATGDLCTPAETVRSDVSGEAFWSDIAVRSERPPHRIGMPAEAAECEVTGKQLLVDEVGQCEVTHQTVDAELLGASELSGKQALMEVLVLCEITGRQLLPDETFVCAVSGRRAAQTLCHKSVISDREALEEELRTCEVTGARVLPEELVTSCVSGRLVRCDQLVHSELTDEACHISEAVKCGYTARLLLPGEAGVSDYTGKTVMAAELQCSAKSGRAGIASEFGECAETGQSLLLDELARSDASGRLVDKSLLLSSARSGRTGTEKELIRCVVSDVLLLPEETVSCVDVDGPVDRKLTATSDVSGRRGLEENMVLCSTTETLAFPGELVTSSVSGRLVRSDQLVRSELTDEICHISEAVKCGYTGRLLLPGEAGVSDYTGKSVAAADLHRSVKSPRAGIASEFDECAETGQSLLLDELARSDVSGRWVDRELLVKSALSGRTGTESELVRCTVSDQPFLPHETVHCIDIDGPVDRRLAGKSDVSGNYGVKDMMETCAATRSVAFPDELVTSSVSGRQVRRDQLVRSELTEEVCHKSEAVKCGYTGRLLHPSEAGTSDYTGKSVAAADLHHSMKSGRAGIVSEFGECAETGQSLLLDEQAQSDVSGRRVDRELLVKSVVSGRTGTMNELVRCTASHQLFHPDETVHCDDVNGPVDRRLTGISEFSGKTGLSSRMVVCPVSGRRVFSSELVTCEITGERVIPSVVRKCSVTGIIAREDQLTRSTISGRWLVPEMARKSFRSGKVMCPDEAVICHWNGRYLAPDEAGTCRRSGLNFSAEYLAQRTGDFKGLQQVAYAKIETEDMSDWIPWVRKQAGGRLKTVQYLHGKRSRNGRYCAVRANLHLMLGLTQKNVCFMMALSPEPRILGRITTVTSSPSEWSEL